MAYVTDNSPSQGLAMHAEPPKSPNVERHSFSTRSTPAPRIGARETRHTFEK